MQEEYTTVLVTSPILLGGELRRFSLGDVIYRQHRAENPNGEVFWITRTENGVTRSSKVWTTRSTMRDKWNTIMSGNAV
ncbi:hypothetical protein [Streptomyces sp. NPDC004528]|uniref:hypothetical protein n=1 Tax=Streptomyces sp. NPDC004528 TaxID=3154550 RepID=UPI0033B20163